MPQLPLSLPDTNSMPFGQLTQLPIDHRSLIAGTPQQSPTPSAPPASAGMMTAPGGAPMGFPAPNAPTQPPFDVKLQPDGSSIYVVPPPQPGMEPIIIGVNKAPRLPPALQQQPPTKPQIAGQ